MHRTDPLPCVLSIAGSDSGSAAGVQADLKTLLAHGVHGLTAVTAITAQNTQAITAIQVLSQSMLLAQLNAVLADFRIAAIKIGMLGNAANIRLVARWLRQHRLPNVIVDPVLVASSGNRLLADNAIAVLRRELLPLAQVLTPNVPEAEALIGRPIRTYAQMRAAAHHLRTMGAQAVLLKGGHLGGTTVRDYFVDAAGKFEFSHRRLNYPVRGTGCTLASAIAANLALGLAPREAVARSEHYLQRAFRSARRNGRGVGRVLQHLPGVNP